MSDECITAPTTSNYKLNPQLIYFGTKTKVKFSGSCLKQDKVTYIHGIKSKDPETAATLFCLGNISKDWSVDKMKKTGLNGYVSDFTVDYSNTAADDILDIHSYLMKKWG